MELRLEGFNYDNSENNKVSMEIRNLIFVQELGLDKHIEFDGKDFKAMHYLLFCNSVPVGVARWTEKVNEITIDRFGIVKEFRKKGFALVFIKFILDDVIPSKKEIRLFTTEQNASFFTFFGFKDNQTIEKMGNIEFQILNY